MSPDRDPPRVPPADEPDEEFEAEAPRSIFSATWFRIVLVLLGVAVVGAVAVPYVLDVVNPPINGGGTRTAVTPAPVPVTPAPVPVTPAPAPPPSVTPAPATPPAAKPAPPSEGAGRRTAGTPAPKPAEKAPAVVAEALKPATPKPATKKETTASGDYFVQVGAFKDSDTAKRIAAQLREQNYAVVESVKRVGGNASAPPAARALAPTGPDRYDVIVSGGSAADINTKLAAKGLASEPAGDGVRIRPSLSLRDAVALSKDLGSEGFKVQVRRGGAASPEPAPPAASSETGGLTLYRVRVGGYPDRAAAQAALRELQEKGFQPFIARGRE